MLLKQNNRILKQFFKSSKQFYSSHPLEKHLNDIKKDIPKLISKELSYITEKDFEIDSSIKQGNFEGICASLNLDVQRYSEEKISKYFDIVQKEIDDLSISLKETVHSKHPVLKSAATYFFNISGKKMRPLIILLLSHVICHSDRNEDIVKKHQKLGEIVEMIHVASLIHDDIVDDSPMRRGVPTLHTKFGNKIAVLSGDFLLARASVTLTKLGNIEVIRLISTIIEHLAHGEIWQIAGVGTASFEEYLSKSFFKTASLIAQSSESTALLANLSEEDAKSCFDFGKHLGLAYQLVDDSLDFTSNAEELGKPSSGADMKLGLTTAPVHFAIQEFPEILEFVERKYENPNDIEKTIEFVKKSNGVEKAKLLAATHCKKAIESLKNFEQSPYLDSLIYLVGLTLNRTK
eukprot:gene2789-4197_t